MSQLLEGVFSGHYSFERRVSSPQVSFTGTAIFEKGPVNQVLYREEGQYILAGREQIYYQKRIFVVEATGLYIYKDDKSVLHEFTIDNRLSFPIKLEHTHHCKDDRYLLTLDIHSADRFSSSYLIKGPSKEYMINTDFTRRGL